MPSRSTPTTRRTTATPSRTAKPRKTATSAAKLAVSASAPSHDDIARRAHELYVSSGFQGGREVEFWLEAEKQLKDDLQLR